MDWLSSLPPEAQALLAALGIDLVKGWAKELVNGMLKAAGKQVAQSFRQEPRQQALEEALPAELRAHVLEALG